jgi:hypothetical protein
VSDSNITVASEEAAAARDLVQRTLRRVNDLLEQDPKFSVGVTLNLNGAAAALDEAWAALLQAASQLKGADFIENRTEVA